MRSSSDFGASHYEIQTIKVNCEKTTFPNHEVCNKFRDYERGTRKLLKHILNDFQTNGNGEIITARHVYSYQLWFDTLCVEGINRYTFINPTTVFTLK